MKHVVVQGLGFVGAVLATVIASLKKKKYLYSVTGLEQNNSQGLEKIKKMNRGIFPIRSTDPKLKKIFSKAKNNKYFFCTSELNCLEKADIIISTINLDIGGDVNEPTVDLDPLKINFDLISKKMKPDCLLVVETTVPPGTCSEVLIPIIKKNFKKRKIKSKINLVHSFERVMPGKNYVNSITDFWRVFSASNKRSEKKFRSLYSKIVNIKKYPLMQLKSFTESETTKILENTYRAVNIAFMHEWMKFCYNSKLDINEILKCIRIRPTHSNILSPGLGVGGYCLTKDPLFAVYSNKKIFMHDRNNFDFSKRAILINRSMPKFSIKLINEQYKNFKNKKVALFGATYKEDIDDTRFSPSENIAKELINKKAKLFIIDPLLKKWNELPNLKIFKNIDISKMDMLVFAVKHNKFKKIDFKKVKRNTIIIDANNCLTKNQIRIIKNKKNKFLSITSNRNND